MQFSLESLLIACAVTAAMCGFIKYDRYDAPFWLCYNPWIVYLAPGGYLPVTASPAYLSLPVLIGLAMGLYGSITGFPRVVRLAWRAIRRRPEPGSDEACEKL